MSLPGLPPASDAAKIIADQDDSQTLLQESGKQTLEQAIAKAREEVDRFDNIVLNIAISGESGAGKSSFVNAIRGLKDIDDGAACTGVVQTTRGYSPYPHPTMPNVTLWDLPGTGEPGFKANTYLKNVNFQKYDFFIIVSATRFRENDIMLAKEIQKKKKNFYFVRSKIDIDVQEEAQKGVTEGQTLQAIQRDCEKNLREIKSPHVFLISSRDLNRFDFQKLIETLETDLPENKRQAFVLSLPVYSQQSLEKKYKTFKKSVWALAIGSGAVGGIPVPGLSPAFDVAVVVSFLMKCYYSFGLDDKSLTKLSERVNKPILDMVKESSLVMAIGSNSFLSTKMAARLGAAGAIETACTFVPVAGNIAAAGISFAVTRSVLHEGLDELYRVAQQVLHMAELE
ncbi:interferon-inducible GTPase 5-like [Sardina pilchardus]|uniref:interferon-inducible GTPase 5-like n=1 Tax=Sardina pilchardus TaxID=27697 RepID=UPI002E0EC42B